MTERTRIEVGSGKFSLIVTKKITPERDYGIWYVKDNETGEEHKLLMTVSEMDNLGEAAEEASSELDTSTYSLEDVGGEEWKEELRFTRPLE